MLNSLFLAIFSVLPYRSISKRIDWCEGIAWLPVGKLRSSKHRWLRQVNPFLRFRWRWLSFLSRLHIDCVTMWRQHSTCLSTKETIQSHWPLRCSTLWRRNGTCTIALVRNRFHKANEYVDGWSWETSWLLTILSFPYRWSIPRW